MTAEQAQTETIAQDAAPAIPQDEDRLRADLYNFLGLMLSGPPDEMLLEQVAGLAGDDTDLGTAINALAKIARLTKPAAAEREFNKLFIGLGRGELLPYASYYLTGFLNEKPLASLRQDMAARGMTRAENVYEPEDNIASLMEMM
ncbi:MAG: TorD/DmsD family molecular chaperone, partial [Phaeobacter italicus]